MKKILLILNGESFRFGSQMTRGRGGEDSFKRQHIATLSHLKLIELLENKFKCCCDVFINTYKLNEEYDNFLINKYQKNTIKLNMYDNLLGGERELIKDTIEQLKTLDMQNYDYILICRIDFFLKKYFQEIFNLYEQITYGHYDSNNEYNMNIPKVNHGIILIPKKYYHLIETIWTDSSAHYLLSSNLVERKELNTFINTFHMCSTDLDWNPIYLNVGRTESVIYNNFNLTFNFEKGYLIEDNLKKYKNLIGKDTIEENINNLNN